MSYNINQDCFLGLKNFFAFALLFFIGIFKLKDTSYTAYNIIDFHIIMKSFCKRD